MAMCRTCREPLWCVGNHIRIETACDANQWAFSLKCCARGHVLGRCHRSCHWHAAKRESRKAETPCCSGEMHILENHQICAQMLALHTWRITWVRALTRTKIEMSSADAATVALAQWLEVATE